MNKGEFKSILADDGETFELVVELLLKNLYPNYKFVHTVYSHDGGKDFYTTSGDEKIWVEAKCYNRHLELSRIAGTFIMADICQINKIIVFSKSQLAKGAFVNLARYSSMHGKTLIVYNDDDIINIIGKSKKLSVDIEDNRSVDEIKKCITHIRKNNKNKEQSEYKQLLTIFVRKLFNSFAEREDIEDVGGVEMLDCSFYAQSNSANPEKLTKDIRAFDVFSAEIIFRNSSLSLCKNAEIGFENNINYYRVMANSSTKSYILEPGQCVSAKFFFRVFNTARNIPLPEPVLNFENKSGALSININSDIGTYIGCRLIGETPYLGIDNQNVSQLNINLNKPNRNFTSVLLYGKSGVGKSRFLQELKNARMESGNQCFLFGGDTRCNSVRDFLRQLLLGYYNFYFDNETGEIILPVNLNEIVGSDIEKSVKFICDVVNSREKEFNVDIARNWFVAFLKNNNSTVLIDNAQSLNGKTFEFINNIIADLQACTCNSEIVLAFNKDLTFTPTANNYFKYYLNTVSKDYIYKINGFDKATAVEYLKESLDPLKIRQDITGLCEEAVDRISPTPLYLKQIVLYLFQQEVIVFQNQTVCFKSLGSLKDALTDLPENIHNTIAYRFSKLIENAPNFERQIKDLFWSVLTFGEFPLPFIDYIDRIDGEVVKLCVDLGFLKYGDNNTLLFEHQLIEKSILIIVQKDAYTVKPVINKIGLSRETAKNYLQNLFGARYSAALFAVEAGVCSITCDRYIKFLSGASLSTANLPLLPYIVHLIEKYNRKFHKLLPPDIVINALDEAIKICQDRLGVNRTCTLFSGLVFYHLDNYKDYSGQAQAFVEFLKYYMYQFSPLQKTAFIPQLNKVGKELLSAENKSDFEIWIDWAQGRNLMHLHDFEEALKTLNRGAEKAEKDRNLHRLAEIEAQLGNLCGYLEDGQSAAEHWGKACGYFDSSGIYDRVLKLVYRGNVILISGDLSNAEELFKELLELYNDRSCYAYLKSIILDFACNYLIRRAVENNFYNEDLDNDINTMLARYRTVALTYKEDVYLFAAYKTVVYNKFIIENYSNYRSAEENSKNLQLMYVLSEELLLNYDWGNSDFSFFYPVFKDIAEVSFSNENILKLTERLSPDKRDLFNALRLGGKPSSVFAPALKRGVLSDKEGKVNLYQFSYKW